MRKLMELGLAVKLLGCADYSDHISRPELAIPEDDGSSPEDDPSTDSGSNGTASTSECGDRREVTRGEVFVSLAEGPCVPPASCTPGDPTDALCCDQSEEGATEEENAAIRAFCQAGILEPFPGGGYRLRDPITSAEFAAVATRILGLAPMRRDGDKTWYDPYYRALEKAGLLPPGELDLAPWCPPSEAFLMIVTRFCYAGAQGTQNFER